jgi:predicted RND superfamily exporter protein
MAAWLASGLQTDSDLRRLLPRDHEVVVNLEKIEETFGSTGSVNVVIKGEAEARHAFSDAIAAELDGNELLRDVDYRLPSDFFVEHALYYLSADEMALLGELIDAWLHYESCSAGDHCLTKPDPEAPERLERFVETKRQEASDRTGFRDMYEREGIDANVMLLRPVQSAASLEFAKRVTDEMTATIAEVHGREGELWSGGAVTYNIVGPYVNKAAEHAIIKRDTVRAILFALTGVIVVLYLLFRSRRAVLIVLVPLVIGVVWSLAAARLSVGSLNLMTSLISTVVMGTGVDAGIHFYVRAQQARREHETDESIRVAFRSLIVPLFVASATTIGAFTIMATSEFPAFREFGIIAALGMCLCLLSMTTVLPALAHMFGIKRGERKPLRTHGMVSTAVLARPGLLLVGLTVVSALAAFGAAKVDFEYDGRALQSDQTRERTEADTKLISQIFQRDIHAGILVRPTLDSAWSTLEQARARQAEYEPNSVVAELYAAPDLLPDRAIDMTERREEIAELLEPETVAELEEIAEVAPKQAPVEEEPEGDDWDEELDDEEAPPKPGRPKVGAEKRKRLTKEDATTLLQMLEAQPFTFDDLPPVLQRTLRADDGSFGVFAFPAFDAADMKKGVAFTRETSSYVDDGALFVGETTVYAAMFLMLRQEAPLVLGIAAVLITVLVFWQVRSIKQTLVTLLPLSLALWWLVGVMGAIDLRFTLFNLPILPAILGIGVDNGVYLTDRIRQSKGETDGLFKSLQETGGAIMAAMATTAIGFAAFMVGDSAGVRGIGAVALLGIVLASCSATLVLPALFGVAAGRKREW